MGLSEQIRAGAVLTRNSITIADVSGSGSVNLGSTYAVLRVEVGAPCRFRLYDDETSRDNVTEIARSFPDTNIPAPIALVGDFSMSAAGIYSVDPVLYGHATNFSTPLSYYRVSPPGTQIQITRYLLEDSAVAPTLGGFYTRDNRRVLPSFDANALGAGGLVSGSLQDVAIPTTYLFVSASLSSPAELRLRLYGKEDSIHDTVEKTRPFHVETSPDTRLLLDMILSGSEVTKFSPKIVGANLENLNTDMREISQLEGLQELYYVLENVGSSPATSQVSVYVYALEK
jgi:hypothetical protein